MAQLAFILFISQCVPDSGKFRHRLRRKIAESKKLLFRDIAEYNRQEPAVQINPNEVELSLSGESLSWPWEVNGSGKGVQPIFLFVVKNV